MMHAFHAVLLVSMMTSVAYAQMGDDWIITVDLEGEDVTFYCNDTDDVVPVEFYPKRWMFPDLTNVDGNFTDGRISVSDDGNRLDVRNVSRYDFGLYHCMLQNDPTGEWFLVKFGLNVRGPYFEDVWAKYETGTIVGISLCLGFIATVFLIWMVIANKWIAPNGWYEDEGEDKARHIEQGGGYTNATFLVDGPPDGAKGYIPVQDKVEVASSLGEKREKDPRPVDKNKEKDYKLSKINNGKENLGPEVNGKITSEKENGNKAEKENDVHVDNMITEL